MMIIKKLLAPVFTGVLVAFLFLAVEIVFMPKPDHDDGLFKAETVVGQSTPQNHNEPIQNSLEEPRHTGRVTLTEARASQNSKIQNYNKPAQNFSKGTRTVQVSLQNSKIQKIDRYLNKKTDNMNVLFIGVDKGKLLACSVFTINYQDEYQAGAVFLPTYSRPPNYKYSFAEIYEKTGVSGLKRVIEKEMGINIELYYSIERELLKQLETYIDPIYVDNKKVELYNLFTMAVSPHDEEILGALTRELLKPGVFFTKLPRLLLDATKYIRTDFKVTLQNLKFHYNNIINLDTDNIKKLVLPTQKKVSGNKIYYEIDAYSLHNCIYEISR